MSLVSSILKLGCVLLLAGCATQQKEYTFKQTQFNLTVIPNTDDFQTPKKDGVIIDGEAVIGNGYCVIKLREYPRCLLHEIRHCIEGDFHKGDNTNDDDC